MPWRCAAPTVSQRVILLFLVCAVYAPPLARAEMLWPEFRGPTAQGHATAKGLPTEWSRQRNILWRTELPGRAWSSPIVANGRVFLTNAIPLKGGDDQKGVSLRVLAIEAPNGSVGWDSEVFSITDEVALKMAKKNSHASPTAVYENGRIYAHFGHYGTACLDESGKVLWTNREHCLKPEHGTGGSPVVVGELLIFTHDANLSPGVVALDKSTGRTRWRVDRPATAARNKFSFGTPLVIGASGHEQVICQGSGIVQALAPQDGREIWRLLCGAGFSVVPRPVHAHGMLFFSSGFTKGVGYAVRTDGRGDVTGTHVAWTATKHVSTSPSMVVAGDELYMLDDTGFLSCLDARTGTEHYQERLLGPCTASLLFADGHIYATDERGKTAVVVAGKTFQVLAMNELGEQTLASMAVCDNDLLIRTEKALYRVGRR